MVSGTLLKAILGALLLLALLTSKCAYDHNRRLEGRNNLLLQQNAALQDSLKKSVARVDVQYVRDTVVRWRTIRETVSLLDTLRLSDTVTLTKRESVIVFAADSAIQTCRSIVTSCEARVAVRDSLLKAITWERDMWKRRADPSWLTRISTATKWVAVGFLIGELKR